MDNLLSHCGIFLPPLRSNSPNSEWTFKPTSQFSKREKAPISRAPVLPPGRILPPQHSSSARCLGEQSHPGVSLTHPGKCQRELLGAEQPDRADPAAAPLDTGRDTRDAHGTAGRCPGDGVTTLNNENILNTNINTRPHPGGQSTAALGQNQCHQPASNPSLPPGISQPQIRREHPALGMGLEIKAGLKAEHPNWRGPGPSLPAQSHAGSRKANTERCRRRIPRRNVDSVISRGITA